MNSMKIVQFQNGKYAVRKGWLDHKFLIYRNSSLAPYFAHQLTQNLVNNIPIDPLADVKRFHRLLSR